MGADLIFSYLVIDSGKTPDWAAGHAAIDKLTDDEIGELDEYLLSTGENDPRVFLHGALTTLSEFDSWRAASRITVRDAEVWIGGGTSWGDSPGEPFDAITDLLNVPNVVDACGFDK